MMDEVTLADKSFQLIKKDFGLEEDLIFEGQENAFDRLEFFLTSQINHLLDSDFNRLLNALYRIDISERKVQEVLNQSPQGTIANKLANAIIEREKQKVITRLKYRT